MFGKLANLKRCTGTK